MKKKFVVGPNDTAERWDVFETIQQAIDAAGKKPATILIKASVYVENYVVDSDMAFKGQDG